MKTIVITGASRGIGYELCRKYIQENHTVVALSRNIKPLQHLKSECKNSGGRLLILQFDLLKFNEHKANLISILNNNGITAIDVLINNAGLLINKAFESYHAEEIKKILTTNFTSPALIIKELIPYLLKSGTKAHVVNISSMGGYQGSDKFAGLSYYSASKAALSSLTECLAAEYKLNNISFNSLALGAVQTEMLRDAFPGYNAPVSAHQMAEYIYSFANASQYFYNGKVLPVSVSTP